MIISTSCIAALCSVSWTKIEPLGEWGAYGAPPGWPPGGLLAPAGSRGAPEVPPGGPGSSRPQGQHRVPPVRVRIKSNSDPMVRALLIGQRKVR